MRDAYALQWSQDSQDYTPKQISSMMRSVYLHGLELEVIDAAKCVIQFLQDIEDAAREAMQAVDRFVSSTSHMISRPI